MLPGYGRRDLAMVMAMASLASATLSLGIPLLSLVLERHGENAFWIGVNGTIGGLGIFLVAPFVGRLVRRFGAVRVMQGALIGGALTLLLFPLEVDLLLWSVWRLLLGCAGATLFVLSEAAVNALAPPAHRNRVIALYATLFSVGYAAGPLILVVTGSEGWLPFALGAAILIASTMPLAAARSVDEAVAAPDGSAHTRPLLAFWRRAPLPFVGVLVYSIIETAFFTLLPVYALANGLGEAAAAMLLSVWIAGNIVLQLPMGWLADRWSTRRTLTLCAAISILSLLMTPLAMPQEGLLWPVFLVMGGAMGAIYALSLSLLGAAFGADELTRANTAFVMTFQIGMMLGPIATGAGMRAAGAAALPVVLLAPLTLVALASLMRGHVPDARGSAA